MAKLAPAKPNWNPHQSANTIFIDGQGWVFTEPATGNTECLVSVGGIGWTIAGELEEVEEVEEEEAE